MDSQDPNKAVFSDVSHALLSVLATSNVRDMERLRSSIELEIANLSRNIDQIFDPDTSRLNTTQSLPRSEPDLQTKTISGFVHNHHPSTAEDQTWAWCDTGRYLEKQQHTTPVSTRWVNRDTDNITMRSPDGSDESTTWGFSPQPCSAPFRMPKPLINISTDLFPTLELADGFGGCSMVPGGRTESVTASSEQNLSSLVLQSLSLSVSTFSRSNKQACEGLSGSFGINRASVCSSYPQDLPFNIAETPMDCFFNLMETETGYQQMNTNYVASIVARKLEPADKRNQGGYIHDIDASTKVVRNLNIQRMLRKFVTTDKDHIIELLCRLTHVIGNAESLLQLKSSISIARQRGNISNSAKYGTHDLAHTMQALDMLDIVSHRSSILRRYFLVRLLRHRLKSEATHHKNKNSSTDYNNSHKSLTNTKASTSNSSATPDSPGLHAAPSLLEKSPRAIRADSQALHDMMKLLYPDLSPHLKTAEQDNEDKTQYRRLLSRLKNRLACARNWHQLAEQCSIGILAIIPSGSKSGISSDQIEKLPANVVASYLNFLKHVKGPFLKGISLTLTEHIFEILDGGDGGSNGRGHGKSGNSVYKLEECDDTAILQAEGNQEMLRDLCSVIGEQERE